MKHLFLCVLVAIWLMMSGTVGSGAEPNAEPLGVGIATADITPPVPYRMSGYFSERLSEGVHDPLHAKAIVLEQGETRVALVFCDLIGMGPDVARRARESAAEETDIPADHIVIAATHTHTGPLYFGALRNHFHDRAVEEQGRDPHEEEDYADELVGRLAGVIAEAREAVEPSTLEAVVARQEGLGFNRRFRMKDGSVRFNAGKENPRIVEPLGPIDPDVGVLMVGGGEGGKPRAALTVFGLHLDTVGGTEYSADYPYYLEQSLRAELGEGFTSIFAIGPCGDINHIDVSHSRPQKGQEEAKRIGQTLGETVRAAMEDGSPLEEPNLAVRGVTVEFPFQEYSEEEVERARERMGRVGDSAVPFLERVEAYKILAIEEYGGDALPMRVRAIRLDDETAIVTLPGEVFVELGLAIEEASPFETTLVVELADDAPGYIPTAKAFAEGSYETVNSRIRTGGGEALAEAAVQLLYELKEGGR